MTQHERLLTMAAELDDQGYSPEQIARAVKVPLDRVTDPLDELDCIPVQIITAEKESTVLKVEIEWAEPPAAKKRGRGRSDALDAILAELQKHPGRWALVQRGLASSGGASWRKRGCETVSRRADVDGRVRYDVYARWVGDATP